MNIETLKSNIYNLPSDMKNSVLAVYLYGSTARNDSDDYSDCDILFVIANCSDLQQLAFKKSLGKWDYELPIEFSIYQIDSIARMHKKGSYYLWHLKTEGIELFSTNSVVKNLLDTLPRYTGTKEDFYEYRVILDDIFESLSNRNADLMYELSVLATVVRNTCIGLCYLKNHLDFGRRSSVKWCIDQWGDRIPFTMSEYDVLYKYRFAMNRGLVIPKCSDYNFVFGWINNARALLDLK